MKRMIALLLLAGCAASFDKPPTESRPAQDTRAVVTPPTVYVPLKLDVEPLPTTTTTVPDTPCAEWYGLAMEVGWSPESWDRLSYICHRESRGIPTALNGSDPNGGSTGLLQINHFWCKPTQYTDNGWLQDQGVLTNCDELYDPATNLRAGLYIYAYSLYRNGDGWNPWRT